jgi:hypothetical protein
MKLSVDLLEAGSTQKRAKDESKEQFLKKVMHISISSKGITQMVRHHF